MTDLDDIEKQLSDLRRRAEASLSESVQLPEAVSALSRSEVEKLVHELRVHQIELEMQNEELKRSQAELEALAGAVFRPLRPGAGGLLHLERKGADPGSQSHRCKHAGCGKKCSAQATIDSFHPLRRPGHLLPAPQTAL